MLHIVLETLTVVIKADAQAAAVWEPHMSPAVLRLWAANVSDLLIALDATEVLQTLAANPAALPNLQVGHITRVLWAIHAPLWRDPALIIRLILMLDDAAVQFPAFSKSRASAFTDQVPWVVT